MRLSILVYVSILASVTTYALAQKNEGIRRWHLSDDDQNETVFLFEADSGATEASGHFMFDCKRHSGTVHVTMVLQDQDRADIGNLIKTNGYPRFEFLPDATGVEAKIETNDYYGWEMIFDVDASSKFLESFGQSGGLRYRLIKNVREYTLATGKEVIPTFVESCRHK